MPASVRWPPPTVTELLRYRAEHDPDRVAYRFLDYGADSDPVVSEISYGDLDRKARDAAAAVAAAGTRGDRVMILCSPGLPYIVHFFGCLYAGMIAVPAFPPGPMQSYERIDAIARDCGATVVLTDTADTARRDAEAGAECGSVLAHTRWLSAEDSEGADGEGWTVPAATEQSLAFLQYTSGSTGQPKGVMLSHGNLLANARAGHDLLGFAPDTPFVGWIPYYHTAGVIGGLIMPLYSMFTAVHMAPMAFVQSPQRWLEAISRYRGFATSAPDFAYSMTAAMVGEEAKQGLDLSALKVAINGAEPVRAEVLDQFAAAFASCGFDKASFVPVYGLTESTLLVTAKPFRGGVPAVFRASKLALEQGKILPATDADDARAMVSCGIPVHGVEMQIVDPATGCEMEPDTVGEIWLRGPSVACGYFQAPQATAATFQATKGQSQQHYLRTGDLGALIDGEIYITGRADDLMIFNGRNIYPLDIEATCTTSDPALAWSRCAAFSVDGKHGAALVVVVELPGQETTPEDEKRFAAAIRRRLSEVHGLSAHAIVLAPAGAVPTTSNGKVQRKGCRAKFLAGDFPEPARFGDTTGAAPDTAAGMEEILCQIFAEVLEVERVDVDDSFFDLGGGDSVHVSILASRIRSTLQVELPMEALFEAPTVAALVPLLSGTAEQPQGTAPTRPKLQPRRRDQETA
jgi:acyl-CoA synthetase (AMP-forming)/AMP-acid ligase II/acyl carrier protein